MSPDQVASDLRDSVRVTRDGFEYHVSYVTRFGQNKTDALQTALEALQNMRAFLPHINMQKSGIRLVVTRWDGESFVEEPGIENLEHATPEEVEALIRNNLQGAPAGPASGPGSYAVVRGAKPGVVRVEVTKKSHDTRFHLVLHRADGRVEDGPLLIRPNMAKLGSERLFRPDVSVSMTAMNDRIIIEQGGGASDGRQTDTLALSTLEDASAVEAVLNRCLAGPAEPAKEIAAPALSPASVQAVPPPQPPPRPTEQIPTEELPAEPLANVEALAAETPPAPAPVAVAEPGPKSEPTVASVLHEWFVNILKSTELSSPDEINKEIFAALRDAFDRPISSNDHGFPTFDVAFVTKSDTPARLELVLTPHYLICNYPFGYMRFGAETRLFLTRLDDYLAFPGHALRGVARAADRGGPVFIICDEFGRFLQSHADRSYKTHFADTLSGIASVVPEQLLWPVSREEQIFQIAAATSKSYGLPVESDRILLDPSAPVFLGFKKAAPRGMEFRDGDDFVRFTPAGVELDDGEEKHRMVGGNVLLGWALDSEGRVCALYRKASGFAPPQGIKLLRFLSEEEKERESASLNLLAWVPA